MKFEDKYPNAIPIKDLFNNMLKSRTTKPCWMCGSETSFIEINFEAPICSEECEIKAWEEYFEACK